MTKKVKLACKNAIVVVPVNRILPTRLVENSIRKSVKYRCIEASILELGLIEPLVVSLDGKANGNYLLLDGHLRLDILIRRGETGAKCLIAEDDEGFTYNHKINRLTAIQEHFMILRAIKSGVSEARIAKTLNVDVSSIRQKRDLLDGICPEAVELLREKRIPAHSLRQLRRVKPIRQIEIAELLCASHNFTPGYVDCLVTTSASDAFVDAGRTSGPSSLSDEDLSRMRHELESVGREFKIIEEEHGRNTLGLVVVIGYLKKLLDNARVVRHLSQKRPEFLTEFQRIVDAKLEADGEARVV